MSEIKVWKPKPKGNYKVKVYQADENMFFDAPLVLFWCTECDYWDKVIADKFNYKYCPNCGVKLVEE